MSSVKQVDSSRVGEKPPCSSALTEPAAGTLLYLTSDLSALEEGNSKLNRKGSAVLEVVKVMRYSNVLLLELISIMVLIEFQ